MKKIIILILISLVLISCKSISIENQKLDVKETINKLLGKDGIITFYDSLEDGIGPRNSGIILVVRPNGKITLYSYAYDIKDYEGYYKIINNDIFIYLESIYFYTSYSKYTFPLLKLEKDSTGFKLSCLI